LDALSPPEIIERRPSISRLAGVLQRAALGRAAEGLCLPLCLLFARHLRFDSADPLWADRDRLVFAPSLAPLGDLLTTLVAMPAGSFAAPGQALGTGAGMALAERLLAARFGRSLVDHRSWVFGAGADLATGAVQEAAWLAGAWRLGRLTAITEVPAPDAPGLAGFAASGWSVRKVAATDAGDVAAAISAALRSHKPTLIACVHTEAGLEHTREDCAEGRLAWAATGRRNSGIRRTWLKRLARHASRADFESAMAGKLPAGWHAALTETSLEPAGGSGVCSTAATLRAALGRLGNALPELAAMPGDAAWTVAGAPAEFFASREAAGQLVQGIGSAMAGAAWHGGLLPVAAQSLGQMENVRPGLRAAASAGLRLVQVLVEPSPACPAAGQRASLRAMRNLHVFRPADASEALECAELAVRRTNGPSVLLLSETKVPILAERPTRTRCAKGGYVVAEAPAPRAATLIASGPELHQAVAARLLLAASAVPCAVVSLPCWEFFSRQEPAWQEAVLGDAPRFGLEGGSGFGWDRWLGSEGLFLGADIAADGTEIPLTARRIADLVLRHLGMKSGVPHTN